MVKYNWHFEHVGLTGQTGGGRKVRPDRTAESAIWPITDQINWPCPSSLIATFDYDYMIQMSILIILANSSS
jgi:hypothetical protein